MAGIRIPLHLIFQVPVADLGKNAKIRGLGVDIDLVIVIAKYERGVGEQPAVENMIPPQGACNVSPIDAGQVLLAQNIPPKIAGEKDPVFLSRNKIHFGIEVVEI